MRTEFRPLSEDDREEILRVRRIAFGRTGERIGRETAAMINGMVRFMRAYSCLAQY